MVLQNQVRIGNLIARIDSKDFEISEVIGIVRRDEWQVLIDSRHSNGRDHESMWINLEKCNPIPLTPELLESCGFTDIGAHDGGGNRSWNHPKFPLGLEGAAKTGYSVYYVVDDEYEHLISVDSLHQLQNLYMDFTGYEIEFTPTP